MTQATRPKVAILLTALQGSAVLFLFLTMTPTAQAQDGSVTFQLTSNGRDSATASVPVTAAGSVHLRYRLRGAEEWQSAPMASAAAAGTVEIDMTGLAANAFYDVEVSSTEDFVTGVTEESFVNRPSNSDLDLHGDNDEPRGIWADDETVWVADDTGNKIYAYHRAGGSRADGMDFALGAAGNTGPWGIWSDGTTMFVVDDGGRKVYAYELSDRSRDSVKEFALVDDHDVPKGIWGDAATLWVVNDGTGVDNGIYAYRRSDGSRDHSGDFHIDRRNNLDPRGIWSDGSTMWVADREDGKVYAYDSATKLPLPDQEIVLDDGNDVPAGLWGDSGILYVVNDGSLGRTVFAYYIPHTETRVSAISLAATSLATATATVWIANPDGTERTVHLRYRSFVESAWTDAPSQQGERSADFVLTGLGGVQRIGAQASFDDTFPDGETVSAVLGWRPTHDDFLLESGNDDVRGIWSDGNTMWAVDDGDGTGDRVYAYDLGTKTYSDGDSFALDAANAAPGGVSADADTMWISDRGDRIYAYTISDGSSYGNLDSAAGGDLNTADYDARPTGVWSDGSIMWVVDHLTERVFAYAVDSAGAPGDRSDASEFELATAYAAPRGMWSDWSTVWVADAAHSHIYAYRLTSTGLGQRLPAREIRLADSNRDPWGIWSDGTTMWVADAANDRVYAYFLPLPLGGDVLDATLDEVTRTGAVLTVTISDAISAEADVRLTYATEPGVTAMVEQETASSEVEFNLTGLSKNAEYDVAVSLDDGDAYPIGGFKTSSDSGRVREFLKTEVVEALEAAYPWLRETYNEMRRRMLPVGGHSGGAAGSVVAGCGEGDNQLLHECGVGSYSISNSNPRHRGVYVHELGHVYTIGTGYMREAPEYRGMGWLYFGRLSEGASNCDIAELYADAINFATLVGGTEYTGYCRNTANSLATDIMGFTRSILNHELPDWFGDTYGATGLPYDTSGLVEYDEMHDLEAVWSDLKGLGNRDRPSAVYALQDAFGGYCNPYYAHTAAFHGGSSRNPWRAGGCVPRAVPVNVTAHDSVAWAPPAYDGGAPVTRYVVEWKGRDEEWQSARSAEVSDPANLGFRGGTLMPGSSVRVAGHNVNGAGASTTVTMTEGVVAWAAFIGVSDGASAGQDYRDWLGYLRYSNIDFGTLTSAMFTADGGHTIDALVYLPDGSLRLTLDREIDSDFVLYVGNEPFTKSGSSNIGGTEYRTYTWFHSALSWDAGDEIAVRLVVVESNAPASGAPAISGAAQVGEWLTVETSGIDDENGLTDPIYTYQWIAVDENIERDIPGATETYYLPVAADVGRTVKVRVNFTDDAGYAESLTSSPTDAVVASLHGAVIWNAELTVGQRTTGDRARLGYIDPPFQVGTLNPATFLLDGAWVRTGSLFYEVEGDLKAFIGTRSSSLGSGDFNLYLIECGESGNCDESRFLIEEPGTGYGFAFSNHGLDWEVGDEVQVRLVINREPAGSPEISGAAEVGDTLSAGIAGLSDPDGLPAAADFTYQWVRNDGTGDSDISGATGSTYALAAADEGKFIKVRVGYTDNADFSESLASEATAAVSARSNSPATGAPTISGTARVGETLTAGTSDIVDPDGLGNPGYGYQWIRHDGTSDTEITGATDSTYTLTEDDAGNAIKVRVSFTDYAGNGESLTSEATAAVAAGSPPDKPTGLSNTATHSSVTLTWDDPGDASITHYQVFRRDRAIHDAGEFLLLEDDTGSAATTYTDNAVAAAGSYVYRVKAVNRHGAGVWSSHSRADTPAAPDQ